MIVGDINRHLLIIHKCFFLELSIFGSYNSFVRDISLEMNDIDFLEYIEIF